MSGKRCLVAPGARYRSRRPLAILAVQPDRRSRVHRRADVLCIVCDCVHCRESRAWRSASL